VPSYDASLERDLEAGSIVLGGGVITEISLACPCEDCGTKIGRRTWQRPLGTRKI